MAVLNTSKIWPRKLWRDFRKGVDKSLPEDALPAGYLATADNVYLDAGTGGLRRDTGYAAFGGVVNGTPQKRIRWTNEAGTESLLLVTTSTVYKWNVGNVAWEVVKGTNATTIAAPTRLDYDAQTANFTVAATLTGATSGHTATIDADSDSGASGFLTISSADGAFQDGEIITDDNGTPGSATVNYVTITVAAITGFADEDVIGIRLDDGTQHKTTANGSPAGALIFLDDALTGPATIGVAVNRGPALSGNTTSMVSWTAWPPDDWAVFTNGVDVPFRYSTSSGDCIVVPGFDYGGSVTRVYRAVATLRNQLWFFNAISDGGTAFPRRIRRCDIGDGTTWDVTVGNAGFEDLMEDIGAGQNILPMNQQLVMYCEMGIAHYEYIGAVAAQWRYRVTVRGEGLAAPAAVQAVEGSHVLLGNKDVYEYRGGGTLLPLGRQQVGQRSAVHSLLYGAGGTIALNLLTRCFLFYVRVLGELWLFYPSGNATVANDRMVRYNLRTGGWFTRTFPNEFMGAGDFSSVTGPTIDELVGTIDDQVVTFDSALWNDTADLVLLMEAVSGGKVFSSNFQAGNDDGTNISWTMETGDMDAEGLFIRVDSVDITAGSGGTCTVSLSVDGGDNFTSMGTFTPSASIEAFRLYLQRVGPRARIKLTGTGSTNIYEISMRYRLESH